MEGGWRRGEVVGGSGRWVKGMWRRMEMVKMKVEVDGGCWKVDEGKWRCLN